MDLNLFVMFDVIYAERNLTRAAEMLNITQPAVSNALNRLRMVFDDELFIRKPHGMEPTPVADNIISQVREALTLLNFSLNEGATFDPVRSEKIFRFSMNDLSQFLLLPPLLEKLQIQAPGVGASCFYVGREGLAKELASGQIDIAIDAPLINDPNLCHQPLSGEEYVCVVRPDHPYSGADITIDEYLSFRHIHVSSRRSGDGFVDAMLNKKGLNRTVAVRVQHYMVAPRIIRHTNLAWTVPRNLAKHLNLRVIELPFELPTMDWHLYWHKSADNDQANRWMRELLLKDG
jgi:DNA-binding transcriptional LysR family regulator